MDAPYMSDSEVGKAVDIAAEALWQADSIRAADRLRSEEWVDQDDKLKDKWRMLARYALNALCNAGYNIQPHK